MKRRTTRRRGPIITNETHFRTDDIRRFVTAGLKAEGMDPDGYRVKVRYARGQTGGWGWLNRRSMILNVARYVETTADGRAYLVNGRTQALRGSRLKQRPSISGASLQALADTLVHEVQHNVGLMHREMKCHGADLSWCDGMVIRARASAIAPKPTRAQRAAAKREKKAASAADALARWKRKLKLAQTKVKKYQRLVREQERRAAARQAAENDAVQEYERRLEDGR